MTTPPSRAKVSPTQVSRDVYLLKPTEPVNDDGQSGPQVILLFGWLNAKFRPLVSYMDKYAQLYPGATQILIVARGSANWSTKAANFDAMRPAADILNELGFFGANPPTCLVHVFSNGGGLQLLILADLLKELYPDARTASSGSISAQCLILDSLPGGSKLGPALQSFIGTIPSVWIRAAITLPLVLLWVYVMTTSLITGKPDPWSHLRAGINEPQFLPWLNKKTPRAYFFSQEDDIVNFKDITAHAELAKELGFNVTTEEFSGSGHVAHARIEPERYWGIVQGMWEKSVAVYSTSSKL